MAKINGKAIGIGIKAGLLSSLCCVLPLILILLGLASIGMALSIVQFKPYFIGLSIVFLVVSLALHFKRNKTCYGASKKFFIGTAITTHVLIFGLLLYVLVPIVAPPVYAGNPKNAATINLSAIHKLSLKINGMTCEGCAYGIQSLLEGLDGVIEAKVNYFEGNGEVIYDSSKIFREQIINSEAFKGLYSAEVIKDELISE